MSKLSVPARWSAAMIALATGVFLLMRLILTVQDYAAQGQGAGAAVWRLLGFFTILTNLWVLVAMTAAALGRPFSPRWKTAVTLAILLVGIVYHVLLMQDLPPWSADWIADHGVHTVVPVLALGWWAAFTDKSGLGVRDLPAFMAAPVLYGGYCLLRGAVSGWYPYFFVDVGRYGLGRVLLNIAGLGLAFALAGLALVWLGQISGQRRAA